VSAKPQLGISMSKSSSSLKSGSRSMGLQDKDEG
jgi:hypothetical protein